MTQRAKPLAWLVSLFDLFKHETKLKIELEEFKKKSEKDYNSSIQQFTRELDGMVIKHRKDLEERVSSTAIRTNKIWVLTKNNPI